MNTFTIRGEVAQIFWGYHCAATLGSWTLEDHLLIAQVAHADPFMVSQAPLTVRVGSIIRPIETLQIVGASLSARLGPKESTHASLSDRHA